MKPSNSNSLSDSEYHLSDDPSFPYYNNKNHSHNIERKTNPYRYHSGHRGDDSDDEDSEIPITRKELRDIQTISDKYSPKLLIKQAISKKNILRYSKYNRDRIKKKPIHQHSHHNDNHPITYKKHKPVSSKIHMIKTIRKKSKTRQSDLNRKIKINNGYQQYNGKSSTKRESIPYQR